MKWRRRSSSPITHWMSSSSRIFYICALLCHFKSEWRPAAQSVCLFPQRPSQPASPSPHTPRVLSVDQWVPWILSSIRDQLSFISLWQVFHPIDPGRYILSIYASILSLIALSPPHPDWLMCNRRKIDGRKRMDRVKRANDYALNLMTCRLCWYHSRTFHLRSLHFCLGRSSFQKVLRHPVHADQKEYLE